MKKAKPQKQVVKLKVGDSVRIVGIPGIGIPNYYLHRDTRRAYRTLIARGRPVRISKIREDGLPWFNFRLKQKNGTVEYHSMCITPDDDNWVMVKHRRTDKHT
jgi:hypothetical protein